MGNVTKYKIESIRSLGVDYLSSDALIHENLYLLKGTIYEWK